MAALPGLQKGVFNRPWLLEHWLCEHQLLQVRPPDPLGYCGEEEVKTLQVSSTSSTPPPCDGVLLRELGVTSPEAGWEQRLRVMSNTPTGGRTRPHL
ncbi:hypothetical protein EYF80_064244 [Liparis tanakae]|uniref:Uncharacterized protein n=1 Tax=Liparis tanakae TaxID=230148 RepID=A0A4Z2EAQ8_9TELE|nr:hypothetical protein EYF80_064244 [Liparis tanakae]